MNVENIEKLYKTAEKEIYALKDFSYTFTKGKFYAIMGHSGSGKSTLIRILGLIDRPSKGNYLFNNRDVIKLNDDELSEIRNKEIGFIFQEFYLEPEMKAYENVMLPMLINTKINKNERKQRALELLDLVQLKERVNHFPKQLSGGEQQRICLARALANNPNYILADEPTGNLDTANEEIVFNILKKLSTEGKCVIVVSHSKYVLKYADYILNLKDGKLEQSNEIR